MTEQARLALWPQPVAGIDEAGRGAWAGPVVAAAVILGPGLRLAARIDDSKRLSPAARERAYAELHAAARAGQAAIGVGAASVGEIDRLNVLAATLLAMRRAVRALPLRPAFILVDGDRLPEKLPCPAEAVVGGDGLVPAIAAASIIAKCLRDRLMRLLARRYPGYGWERGMGYGTDEHRQALERLGPTAHHRLSFAPLKSCGYVAKESHESMN